MTRFWTADFHFGHDRIRGFSGRPFTDAHHMHCSLVDLVNDHVGPGDELWILGDLAMGDPIRTLPIVRRFNAERIVLVAGNHDRVHPYATRGNQPKADRWLAEYRERSGISEIHLTGTTAELPDGTVVDVSHFPYAGDSHDMRGQEDRYAAWRTPDTGRWLLCGHVHTAFKQRGRVINVGVDAWSGIPISDDDVLALIAEGPRDLPADPWANPHGYPIPQPEPRTRENTR